MKMNGRNLNFEARWKINFSNYDGKILQMAETLICDRCSLQFVVMVIVCLAAFFASVKSREKVMASECCRQKELGDMPLLEMQAKGNVT